MSTQNTQTQGRSGAPAAPLAGAVRAAKALSNRRMQFGPLPALTDEAAIIESESGLRELVEAAKNAEWVLQGTVNAERATSMDTDALARLRVALARVERGEAGA